MCRKGTFRPDLLERMNGVHIHMPSLRQMNSPVHRDGALPHRDRAVHLRDWAVHLRDRAVHLPYWAVHLRDWAVHFVPNPSTASENCRMISGRSTIVEPAAFCFSHPRMLLPAYPGDEPFELQGMGPREKTSFIVPRIELSLQLSLGAREYEMPLSPDTLCVFPDHARFYVLARRAFVYQFVPERRRRISIHARPARAAPPPLTIRAARAAPSAGVPIVPDDDDLPIPFEELLRLNPMTELTESLPLCPSG